MTKYIWSVVGISVSSAVSQLTASVSQWLFAESYWTLGFKIERNKSMSKNSDQLVRIKRYGKILLVMMVADSVLTLATFLCI